MRRKEKSECPECGPIVKVCGPAGIQECPLCGWEVPGSNLSLTSGGSQDLADNPQVYSGSGGLFMGSVKDWSGVSLSNSDRKRARRLDRSHRREEKIHNSKNLDPMFHRVSSAIRVIQSGKEQIPRSMRILEGLRLVERGQKEVRMFRKGCVFSAESVAICLLEIIDRENGVSPPDTKRRIRTLCESLSPISPMDEKKLRRAVMRTRRVFKTLLATPAGSSIRRGLEWSAPVVNQGEANLSGDQRRQLSTIIERTISESKALRMTDKPTITEYCEKLISKSAELDLSGAHFSTIVDICAMHFLEKQSRNLRPDDTGFSRTPLNWITKARTVLSEVSAIS